MVSRTMVARKLELVAELQSVGAGREAYRIATEVVGFGGSVTEAVERWLLEQ